ncbi:MAG TPA: hypothetical protein VOA64_02345 [Candidatus Dormibacteraeota bacterium]|nr:hypothetical protein [Candidatus Dormibacteraeota bacterium]
MNCSTPSGLTVKLEQRVQHERLTKAHDSKEDPHGDQTLLRRACSLIIAEGLPAGIGEHGKY